MTKQGQRCDKCHEGRYRVYTSRVCYETGTRTRYLVCDNEACKHRPCDKPVISLDAAPPQAPRTPRGQ